MNEFTFLTIEQIWGEDRLEIFKKYGTKCAITDFSILLAGAPFGHYFINEENLNEERTGCWWTKTPCDNNADVVVENGSRIMCLVNIPGTGARPAIHYSSISRYVKNRVRNKKGILEVEYGEYPQTVVSEDFSRTLEKAFETMAYSDNGMKKTGKSYTTGSANIWETNPYYQTRTHTEYEYKGRKYIRFIGDSNCEGEVLSDGRRIQNGSPYWVKVEPIKWMIDKKADIALSKKIIFSGIKFNRERNYEGNFSKTDIKEFMDEYFSKDIMTSINKGTSPKEVKQDEEEQKTHYKKSSSIDSSKKSDEEIIKAALECNVPVFLHGPSLERKKEIIKQIDPRYEIVEIKNETLDSFIGKNQENETVTPAWYTSLVKKCTNEPKKIHIVFLDDFTNADPSIQEAVNNIVLTSKVNSIWELPKNTRIVISENEIEESYATNPPKESNFNSFINVYIKDKYISWIEWASKNNIHPAICAYIAYKKDDMLRNGYNGKIPKAEPKKWELASDMLYKTNNPQSLKAIIEEDIVKEFEEFYNQKVMTLEELLNGIPKTRNLSTAEKYAIAMNLSQVDESYFEAVRSYVLTLCGEETGTIFDLLWSKNNEERLEIISESKIDIKKKIRKIQNTNREE